MSLTRAFTRRTKTKPSFAGLQISAPVELLSTTNMLSYNAPDLYPSSSGSRSSQSSDESDRSPSSSSSTPMSSPSTSSVASSPMHNHLSCYFGAPSSKRSSPETSDAPVIPHRSPSHTKQHSMERSNSRVAAARVAKQGSASSIAHASMTMFAAPIETVEEDLSFDHELAQVTKDLGITSEALAVVEAEEQELLSLGLCKFRAEDYLGEISGLFTTRFGGVGEQAMWI